MFKYVLLTPLIDFCQVIKYFANAEDIKHFIRDLNVVLLLRRSAIIKHKTKLSTFMLVNYIIYIF